MRIVAIPKYLRLPLLLGILILAVLLALWLVQQKNVNSLAQQINALQQQIDALPPTVTPKDKLALEKDRLILEQGRVNAQNAIYGTLIQALGGAFFVITAYFTYRNVRAAEANVKATEEKQVTERFSKAVELLGSDKLEVRLGAIYALERIAKDSEKDYWTIMEVLTGFVRERSRLRFEKNSKSGTEKSVADIEAVLTVLNRRTLSYERGEKYRLDLSRSDFSWMRWGYRISFKEMNLKGANFQEAGLIGAEFTGAELIGAHFFRTHLFGARFIGAQLMWANLSNTDLRSADLRGANFVKAKLSNAKLCEANFSGADLQEVTDLTQQQISEAITSESTKLPAHLQSPKSSQPEPPAPEQP